MLITYNKAGVRLTKKRSNLLEAAAFYAKMLKIDNYDVTVNIIFKHLLLDTFSVYAQVEHISTHRINIEFDADLPAEVGLQKLAHEFVHVKQYIKGQLAENKKGQQLWKNAIVDFDLPYHLTPWEVEAMEKEVCMLHAFTFWRNNQK